MAVMKDDVDVIRQIGYVPMRGFSGHKNHIGFLETIGDALDRPSQIHERQMSVKDADWICAHSVGQWPEDFYRLS